MNYIPTLSPSGCSTITLRHDRGFVQAHGPKPQIIINLAESLFPLLPPALLVGLPVSDLESPRLAGCPGTPRRGQRIVIVAVKDQNYPLIGVRIGGQSGIIDQEPDIGPVRIALLYRQHDWLILRIAGAPGGMRQERIVAIGPQMGVE